MAPILTKYKIQDGAVTWFFLGNPATYTGIGTDTGVSEAAAAEQNEPVYKVSELLGQPEIQRLVIYYKVTVGTAIKQRKAEVLCLTSLVEAALNKGTFTYKGAAGARFKKPRRASFY